MDVNRAQGVAAVLNNKGGGGNTHDHPQKDQNDGNEERDTETESIEIGGLAAEITPAAQQALDALVAELEPLRLQLAFSKEREQQLREDLAKHDFLPVPGRREFLRELNHVLNHLRDLTVMPSLALLHLKNADIIRRQRGRDALDRFLIHAANAIAASLQPNDVFANIGGNDFGLILLGADDAAARDRIAQMLEALAGQPYADGPTPLAIEIATGIAELRAGASAEAVMRDADRDMVG